MAITSVQAQSGNIWRRLWGMSRPLQKDELYFGGQFMNVFPLTQKGQLIAADDPKQPVVWKLRMEVVH
jgi:hypothetical protein